MTTSPPPRTTRVVFLVNRAPAIDRQVDLPNGLVVMTDSEGAIDLTLPAGRYQGVIHLESEKATFEVALAAGLSEVAVRLTCEQASDLDPHVQAAMPSDRYRPIELLGRGAAGSVYRCFDETLRREVAVKLLDQNIGTSSSEREAFLQEGRALAAIDHPNLIDIFDLGFHNSRGFMVVQFVDGPDLDRLLQSEGRLSAGAAAAVGVQLARALDALHRAGLLHRDVKPSNGLVDRTGTVRLADFGLVRPILDFSDPRSKVFGTPAYMSPEQLQALPLGPASDVYGLGATLYHLATGKLAFGGTNMILSHVTEPPPDPRDDVADMPAELADVILSMMQKEPSARVTALEAAVALSEIASRVESPGRGRYQPRLASSEGSAPAGEPQTRMLIPTLSPEAVPAQAPRATTAPHEAPSEVEEKASNKGPWIAALAFVVACLAVYAASEFGDPAAPEEPTAIGEEQDEQRAPATLAADPANAEPSAATPGNAEPSTTDQALAAVPNEEGSADSPDTTSAEPGTAEQATAAANGGGETTGAESPSPESPSPDDPAAQNADEPVAAGSNEADPEERASRRDRRSEPSPEREEREDPDTEAAASTAASTPENEPQPAEEQRENEELPEAEQGDAPAVAGVEAPATDEEAARAYEEASAAPGTDDGNAATAQEAAAGVEGTEITPPSATPVAAPEPPPVIIVPPAVAAPAESEAEAEEEEDSERPRRQRGDAPPLGF